MTAVFDPPLTPVQHDAVSVLAYHYILFDQPEEGVTLLEALIYLKPDAPWPRRARCLALLRAGRNEEAAAEGAALLERVRDDGERLQVLRIMAMAAWRLGRAEEAKEHQKAVQALTAVSIVPAREPQNGSGLQKARRRR